MDEKIVEIDLVYKYQKWRDFLAFCEPNVVYPIKPDRPDREQLIEALKQLHDTYGIVHFMHDYSGFMRIDPKQVTEETLKYIESMDPEKVQSLNESYSDYISSRSNDNPSGGTLIPPTENKSSDEIKSSQNENNKTEEDEEEF